MGLSSPGTSSEISAAMTLRITKTSSKVVMVHLEEAAGVLFGQLSTVVEESTTKALKSHCTRGCSGLCSVLSKNPFP